MRENYRPIVYFLLIFITYPYKTMTIKKRIAISNILMIMAPIVSTIIIVSCTLFVIYLHLIHANDLSFVNVEDFNVTSHAMVEVLEERIEAKDPSVLDNLDTSLEKAGLSLVIFEEEDIIFHHGRIPEKFINASKAIGSLSESSSSITIENENLYSEKFVAEDKEYTVFIYGLFSGNTYERYERIMLIIVMILLLTVILSICITNRILVKFIFSHIENPLKLLVNGVEELKKGNLEYHIEYTYRDEFYPVFLNFNQMAMRLRESVEEKKAEEEKARMLMTALSHDLRSPLTSIKAYVEGLLDGVAYTKEAQIRYILTIKRKTEELESIVSRILSYSRMDSKEYQREEKVMRLDIFLSSLFEEIGEDYKERGMEIILETTPALLSFDGFEMKEMITNIADNSLKYKKGEKCTFIIRLEKMDGCIYLSFSDNGPGVKGEDLERIFDLFYRANQARDDRKNGSGIGLAVVKRTVERMKGRIWAENIPSGGLRIIMRFRDGGEDAEHSDN